ncbi:TPA: class A beta-lactamase [Candidatus Spyradomonas excrementavium]|nr:class A beta-lactamase [Candidatus Spyradomonas excrementavium]
MNYRNVKIGISVIKDNKVWSVGKTAQPMLSVFKYIVALKVLDKIDRENISPDQKIKITEAMVEKSLFSPMLDENKSFPFEITISRLLQYMISESDNNACDILIDYAGGVGQIASYVHNIGYENIKITVNEKDMNENIEKQYANTASTIDIARLMKSVDEGKILSEKSTDFLKNLMLKTTTGENKIKAGLPDGIIVGHKTGSSSRKNNRIKIADNDAAFVVLPDGEVYYLVVFLQDSVLSDSKNADLFRRISEVVFEEFSRG